MYELKHSTLNATLAGVDLGRGVHFRGLQYADVEERFGLPVIKSDWNGQWVGCTHWGPRCPQSKMDVGYLLREPEGNIWFDESEDEFACLNLDISVPKDNLDDLSSTRKLPVLFWVHGGSQIISYGNGASKIGCVWNLMRDSLDRERPIIIVSVQYRLNIFHVGDGNSNKNLGFKDLQTALEWVHEHIAGFGGDPNEITLAGESAGAALSHGLIAAGAEVKRAVLMSGSLHMSPPQPESRARVAIIDPVMEKLKLKGYRSMKEAPVAALIEAQEEVPIRSVFLQAEADLADWSIKAGQIEELMVGDCEFESILWRNGIHDMSARQIMECFGKGGASAPELKKLYHISEHRASSTRNGALDFMNDILWAKPTWKLAARYQKEGKKVYTYLFDQANPWQASARAHHAIDLVFLFGGFDLAFNPTALAVAREMRQRFIRYVNGEAPWSEYKTCAFGPIGQVGEIGTDEVAARRRMGNISRLRKMPPGDLTAVVGSLAAGRISLLN